MTSSLRTSAALPLRRCWQCCAPVRALQHARRSRWVLRIRRPRAARRSTTITASRSPTRTVRSRIWTRRRPAPGSRRRRVSPRPTWMRSRSARGCVQRLAAALRLRAHRHSVCRERSLLLHQQQRAAGTERAAERRPAQRACQRWRSIRTCCQRAAIRWSPATSPASDATAPRLRRVAGRLGLDRLAHPRSRHRPGPAGGPALHQVLPAGVHARRARRFTTAPFRHRVPGAELSGAGSGQRGLLPRARHAGGGRSARVRRRSPSRLAVPAAPLHGRALAAS